MKEPLLPGCYYHIYNRGNNSENIFIEEENYSYFLQKYTQHCFPVFDTYAYCLLKNHFHLFIRVRKVSELKKMIGQGMISRNIGQKLCGKEWSPQLISHQLGNLFNGYTQAFNKKYDRTGTLFEKSFNRKKVDENGYFCNLVCYIHRNPQLHGLVENFRSYHYSSYLSYLSESKTHLNKTESFRQFGGYSNFKVVHNKEVNLPDKYIFD